MGTLERALVLIGIDEQRGLCTALAKRLKRLEQQFGQETPPVVPCAQEMRKKYVYRTTGARDSSCGSAKNVSLDLNDLSRSRISLEKQRAASVKRPSSLQDFRQGTHKENAPRHSNRKVLEELYFSLLSQIQVSSAELKEVRLQNGLLSK